MSIMSQSIISIIAIFAATSLGASMVFLLRKKPNAIFSNIIFGITSGIMMSASIFGLIIPSIDQAKSLYKVAFIPIVASILLGSLFLYSYLTLRASERRIQRIAQAVAEQVKAEH